MSVRPPDWLGRVHHRWAVSADVRGRGAIFTERLGGGHGRVARGRNWPRGALSDCAKIGILYGDP